MVLMLHLRWQDKVSHVSLVFSSLMQLPNNHPDVSGNILGTVFPFFTQRMFSTLGYKWANTLFGCIALLMMPIPFVRNSRSVSISILSHGSIED
jgi:hypothetical protein